MTSPPPNPKPQNPEENLNLILSDLLHHAQKSAQQLTEMILINGMAEGKDLRDEVVTSFSKVISALNSPREAGLELESSEVSNGKRKLNHVDQSHEKTNRPKRARQASSIQKTMSKTVEDGHAWRKYGQKHILNSNNPRSYYRCTHKSDQGCQAIKQVQKSEEDPNIFIITYAGNHTCKNPYSLFQIPSSPHESNGTFISFGSCTTNHFGTKMNQNQDGLMSPRSLQSSKQEGGEEAEVLSKSTVVIDPTAAQTSDQDGPIRTGLNCSNAISNNEELLFDDTSYDGLEDIINYDDFDFGSFR